MSIDPEVRDAAAGCVTGRSVRTPFYLLALDDILASAKAFRLAWLDAFPRVRTVWSYKTNPLSEIGQGLRAIGYGAEVTNESEWAWALADGHGPAEIIVNGPAKSDGLVSVALDTGALIQIDSLEELETWLGIFTDRGRDAPHARIGLRLTHPLPDGTTSRFGLTAQEAKDGLRLLSDHGVAICALHLHTPAYAFPSGRLEALCAHQDLIRQVCEADPTICLNLGGGDPAPEAGRAIHSGLKAHISQVKALLVALGLDPARTSLTLEPGRAIVESSGVLVSKVLARKRRGSETVLICDARSECLASRGNEVRREVEGLPRSGGVTDDTEGELEAVTLYGSHCYEADLAIHATLPARTRKGSVLLFGAAGAYDLASAGSWSGLRPPIMLLKDGRVRPVDWREHAMPNADPVSVGISAKDDLFDGPWPQEMPFSFSKEVVDVFDDMIARSVPLHDELQDVTARLALGWAGGFPIFDLGCSTGTTLTRIASLAPAPLHLVGIDNSSAMLDRAREKLDPFAGTHRVDLHRMNISEVDYDAFGPPGAVIMNLVAQFMRPFERQREIERIYAALRPGGAFLFVEKVLDESLDVSSFYIREYHRRKIAHGYSEMEVLKKREALENRLIPFHPSENIEILRRAGFAHVSIYFAWLNFQGYLAVKEAASA